LQLAELFNYVDDVPVWVKDREGRFCWVNRAILVRNWANVPEGQTATESDILGKTDFDVFPAFLADQYHMDDEHVLAGNRIVNRIELVRQPDGTATWHATTKIPLVDEQRAIIGTAGLARQLDPSSRGIPGIEFGPVLDYMRHNYHTPITNRHLARLAHMSVRAFERKFHSTFHLTPQKYLRQFRMRMASHALIYTNQLLAQVALSCGFADQSNFSREFRRHFGQTPREYRQHYAAEAAAAAPRTNSAAG
jgi:AraC-like DNA-binding protein